LLLNGTSDFIEIDTAVAIALIGSGSGVALAPATTFRADQGDQRSESALRHDQLSKVYS
jgi:3'-phosphoadenosine 5'-phosphosulfate (PAPS) 3'-phosphatase